MLDLEFVIRKLVTMIWELRLMNEPTMADDLLDVLVKICTEEANRGAKKNEPSDSIGWTGKGKENAPSYYGQPINYCCHESTNVDDAFFSCLHNSEDTNEISNEATEELTSQRLDYARTCINGVYSVLEHMAKDGVSNSEEAENAEKLIPLARSLWTEIIGLLCEHNDKTQHGAVSAWGAEMFKRRRKNEKTEMNSLRLKFNDEDSYVADVFKDIKKSVLGDMKNPLYLYHCKECGLYSLRRAVFPEMEECRACGNKCMDFVMKRGGGYHDDVYDYVEKRGGKIF